MVCRLRLAAFTAVAMAIGLGCAEGMPGPDEFGRPQTLGNAANQLPSSMGGGIGAAGGMGGTGSATPETPPTIMGPPCMMGARAECTCSDGVMIGIQMCMFDPMSPTQGSFGMCMQCMIPAPTEPPDAGMPPAAGAGGSAGMAGGAAGMAGGSAGMAGSAGRSGSGGMAGTTMPPMMCDPDDCPPTTGLFGIERDPCCTRGGRCGGINALSGDCVTD